MVRNKWMIIAVTAISALLIGLFSVQSRISPGGFTSEKVSPEDEQAILQTLVRAQEVEIASRYTLDGSNLAEVYVNDTRARRLDDEALKLIRFMRQDDTLSASDVGFLDYRQAVAAWYKYAIEKREAILARMVVERRDQMTDDERASLVDATGRVAIFGRGPDPATVKVDDITIRSIELSGDVATVMADTAAYTYQAMMVKVKDHWYIADEFITEDHF